MNHLRVGTPDKIIGIKRMILQILLFVQGDTLRVEKIIEECKKKWESIQTYYCEYKTWQKKGEEIDERVYEVKFKKPLWTRLKVLEGKNKGGEALYNPEKNIVRGRKGGILKMVVLTLKPDDKRVVSPLGFKTYDAGISGVYIRFFNYVKEGYKIEYAGKFEEKDKKGFKLVIHINNPSKYFTLKKEEIWFTEDFIPYKTIGYNEKGEKVLDALFYKVKLNIEIPEKVWKL